MLPQVGNPEHANKSFDLKETVCGCTYKRKRTYKLGPIQRVGLHCYFMAHKSLACVLQRSMSSISEDRAPLHWICNLW
jgi:hypothetical protein